VFAFFPDFAFAGPSDPRGQFGKLLGGATSNASSRSRTGSADIGRCGRRPAARDRPANIHDTHFIGLVCGVPNHVFLDRRSYRVTPGRLPDDGSYLYGTGGPAVHLLQRGRHDEGGRSSTATKSPWEGDAGLRIGNLPVDRTEGRRHERTASWPAAMTRRRRSRSKSRRRWTAHRRGRETDYLSGNWRAWALVMCYRECEIGENGQKTVAIA